MLTTTTESLQNVAQKLYAPLPPMVRVPLAADIEEGIRPFFPPEPHEPWRIGYVGQLYPLQGVDLLIKALSLLPERVFLDIIGGKDAHIDALRTLARERGVEHRTRFHGFLPPCEVASRAAQVHILAAPSLALGKMPFVAHTKIYEYLAWGRPIVAADLPSIREEIADGTNGLLFEAGNVQSLAQAILKIMSHPDLAGTLIHNGLAHAGEYSWDKRTLKLEDCFRRVLNHEELEGHSAGT
jgi:glycosyltransferase involved in cell wall biosynthesis